MAHTPGPWALHVDRVLVLSAGPKRQAVVDCAISCSPNLPEAEIEANAQLIAAAPELLSAVKKLRRVVDVLGLDPVDADCCSILEQVDIAIAKAEGK